MLQSPLWSSQRGIPTCRKGKIDFIAMLVVGALTVDKPCTVVLKVMDHQNNTEIEQKGSD